MELVRFESLSTAEKPLVDALEASLLETGLVRVERHGDNLVVSVGEGRPWLLLNSHTDVVPASPQADFPQFEPFLRDGRVYGRGTTDAKGCGTAMLKALVDLAVSGWRPAGTVSVALTVCEETAGEHNGMEALRGIWGERKPDAAVVGEPTSLEPVVAQKGLLVVRLDTQGESGHAARVDGANAIYRLAEAIEAVGGIRFEPVNPFIGGVKVTPTTMAGGTVRNAHPEAAHLYLDIRTIPELPTTDILATLRARLPDHTRISVHSDRFVAVATDPTERIVRLATEVSGKAPVGSPTASDWVFLRDVPTVKFGPGHSRLSHTADEHLEIAQLHAGVAHYRRLIQRYFESA